MPRSITLEIHHGGGWHAAATVTFFDPAGSTANSASLAYRDAYFFEWGLESIGRPDRVIRDWKAASARLPLQLDFHQFGHWPPFLLDLLPQGQARKRLMAELGYAEDDRNGELDLLLQAAGHPIGNLRIREAWTSERDRLHDVQPAGLTEGDIFQRTQKFTDIADGFAYFAAGTSGVQGEWPKVLLTRKTDGLWYPDPYVADGEGVEYAIFKFRKDNTDPDGLILASEASYLEVARRFGLRVGESLTSCNDVLKIPRFDRMIDNGRLVRLGQESIVSASGIAQFGYRGTHEQYVATIRSFTTDPAREIMEYLMRDILNLAMGNPDNHGRNTALQKRADGTIRLTPLFDFAPMTMDARVITRATRWACLGSDEYQAKWGDVAEELADERLDRQTILAALAAKADFIADLPAIARDCGVPEAVITRACTRHEEIAASLRRIGG
jgi:serine/threonine-protein kinase HipA